MENSSELPVDLPTIGRRGDQIKITKVESPIGTKLYVSPRRNSINSPPVKKTTTKIKLARPITVGQEIIKICKKKDKNDGKTKKEYFATLSPILKIECVNGEDVFAYSEHCKYKILFI